MRRLNVLPTSADEIPVGGVLEGVTCDGCPTSACCHDMTLELTSDEVGRLVAAGTDLEPEKMDWLGKIRHQLGGRAVYIMTGRCGNLKEDSEGGSYCAVHGTDAQPKVCKAFPPGCVTCILAQLRDRRAAK